jgi:hypothetical protein
MVMNEIDIQKKQLEDLIRQKNAKINEEGKFDDTVVNKLYKSICDKVLTLNKK